MDVSRGVDMPLILPLVSGSRKSGGLMRELEAGEGGGLDSSPVNLVWIAAVRKDRGL
jgi:hypothetical protein